MVNTPVDPYLIWKDPLTVNNYNAFDTISLARAAFPHQLEEVRSNRVLCWSVPFLILTAHIIGGQLHTPRLLITRDAR